MEFPEELKYTEEHEWVKIEDGIATIGITEFAQKELGDIVYVEVETVGDELKQNDVFGTIEAVKTVSDLFLPLSGEVIELNEDLEDSPENVNENPYSTGWIIKLKIQNDSEVKSLLSAEDYKGLIGV